MGRTKRKRQKKKGSISRNVRDASPECIRNASWASSHGLLTANLDVYIFPETGRGLRCRRNIKTGTCLVSVPHHLLITVDKAVSHCLKRLLRGVENQLNHIQLLCLFLIYERCLGSDSYWYPYIAMLPHTFTIPPLLNEGEMSLLPSHLQDRADGMKVSVMEQYDDMQRKVSFCDQLIHLVTLKDFKWAWSVVNTRSVYFGDEKRCQGIASGSMALAPYLDILNHSATAEVEAKYSKLTKRYEIFTKTSYRKGEQVFISYGAHNNDTLLLEYGFILKHNPHSTFQMDEVLRGIAAGNVERKNAILKGLNLTCDLSCTVDGPSWKLMTALRIWNMSNSELVHWQTVLQGHVSDKNERLCTEQLTLHCINLLSTIHKAITTISTQPHSSLHSSCMAIQLEYKHIVQNTINKLQAVVL
ncbi:SET domain-containing protein 4-like [Corticium candelabrum]|uniref:SET domain-containing protein 4-like n=1 Tax=Corticium candelabrum TaxID=121492 RepID=UPI002E270A44|nr:SET domain-containing protein 4-like [Corticium candelabrum]